MDRLIVKRLLLVAGLGAASVLASCDEPRYEQEETIEFQIQETEAAAAEDSAAPVVAEVPKTAEGPPVDTLPPEQRSSEQSVQPESETLFY